MCMCSPGARTPALKCPPTHRPTNPPPYLSTQLCHIGSTDIPQVIPERYPTCASRQCKVQVGEHGLLGRHFRDVTPPFLHLFGTPVMELVLLTHLHVAPMGHPKCFVVDGYLVDGNRKGSEQGMWICTGQGSGAGRRGWRQGVEGNPRPFRRVQEKWASHGIYIDYIERIYRTHRAALEICKPAHVHTPHMCMYRTCTCSTHVHVLHTYMYRTRMCNTQAHVPHMYMYHKSTCTT